MPAEEFTSVLQIEQERANTIMQRSILHTALEEIHKQAAKISPKSG